MRPVETKAIFSMAERRTRRREIEKIEDLQKRRVTFSKRRRTLFKHADDLCRSYGGESSPRVEIIIFSPGGRPYTFGISSDDSILDGLLSGFDSDQQRAEVEEEREWDWEKWLNRTEDDWDLSALAARKAELSKVKQMIDDRLSSNQPCPASVLTAAADDFAGVGDYCPNRLGFDRSPLRQQGEDDEDYIILTPVGQQIEDGQDCINEMIDSMRLSNQPSTAVGDFAGGVDYCRNQLGFDGSVDMEPLGQQQGEYNHDCIMLTPSMQQVGENQEGIKEMIDELRDPNEEPLGQQVEDDQECIEEMIDNFWTCCPDDENAVVL